MSATESSALASARRPRFSRRLLACSPRTATRASPTSPALPASAAPLLYRYYPSREALLAALTAEALDELAGRLADAGLETVGVEEAIGRTVRAVLTVGDRSPCSCASV